jgi:hypothetical protein
MDKKKHPGIAPRVLVVNADWRLHKKKRWNAKCDQQKHHCARYDSAKQGRHDGHKDDAEGVNETHWRQVGQKLGGAGVVSCGPTCQANGRFFGHATGELGGFPGRVNAIS